MVTIDKQFSRLLGGGGGGGSFYTPNGLLTFSDAPNRIGLMYRIFTNYKVLC